MFCVAFLPFSSILQAKPIWGENLRIYFKQFRENALSVYWTQKLYQR